jgi:hypothetical protein
MIDIVPAESRGAAGAAVLLPTPAGLAAATAQLLNCYIGGI